MLGRTEYVKRMDVLSVSENMNSHSSRRFHSNQYLHTVTKLSYSC